MNTPELRTNIPLATTQPWNVISLARREALLKPVKILYSDPSIIVIDKPSGITSVGQNSMIDVVQRVSANNDVFPVHRLDTDTTGVLVFGRSREIRANLSAQFKDRGVSKSYIALVKDRLRTIGGIIAPLARRGEDNIFEVSMADSARTAATGFRQIGTYQDPEGADYSLLRIRLFTGRTHQIRAHLLHLGLPIAGDRQYGPNDNPLFRRQMLHASSLTLTHPTSGEQMTFHAPYPADFPRAIQPVSAI